MGLILDLVRMLAAFPSMVHVVDEAAGGLEAVELIERERPEIVFLDVAVLGDGARVEVSRTASRRLRERLGI